MAFIIRNCCGIVCVPLTGADARRLQLNPMVARMMLAGHRIHDFGRYLSNSVKM